MIISTFQHFKKPSLLAVIPVCAIFIDLQIYNGKNSRKKLMAFKKLLLILCKFMRILAPKGSSNILKMQSLQVFVDFYVFLKNNFTFFVVTVYKF